MSLTRQHLHMCWFDYSQSWAMNAPPTIPVSGAQVIVPTTNPTVPPTIAFSNPIVPPPFRDLHLCPVFERLIHLHQASHRLCETVYVTIIRHSHRRIHLCRSSHLVAK